MAQGSRWEDVCACFFFFFFFVFFFFVCVCVCFFFFVFFLFVCFFFVFFCDLILHFFLFSVSLSLFFSFAFSCAFRILGHFNRACFVLTGLHYEYTTVNRTFLVRNFDHFFPYFYTLPLHARELVFILLLPPILPYRMVLELEDCLY